MVNGVFNAVFVRGNMLGDSMYYGRGAGKLPTASAVVSDVIDCARHMGKVIMCFWDAQEANLVSIDETSRKFFVRLDNKGEALAKELFGDFKPVRVEWIEDEFAFITPELTEKEFAAKYAQLAEYAYGRIRVEE
jgi:homoserine dehydrogenase